MNYFNSIILTFTIFITFSCSKQTVFPSRGEVVEAVYGLGIIQSENVFHAKAAIISSVDEFFINEGDDVKRGQKLFTTDQGNLVKAPFDGRITQRHVTVSENLFPQTVILSLVDLDELFLEVSLEQQGAMKLKKGMKAEISFEFFRNQKFFGTIKTIYPKNDQFIAKVISDNWPSGILPGMSADVAFEVDRKKDVMLVPIKAIANNHIVIKRNGKKEKLKVTLGLTDQEKAEVLSPNIFESDEIILP
jgi:macrolide-specific efflux system membrane fusion protein